MTYQRIFSEVLDPLFTAFKPPSITIQEGPLTKRPRIDSDKMLDSLKGNSCLEDPEEGAVEDSKLRYQLCQKLFDVTSGPDAREANRKKIYAFWKTLKAEEASERDRKRTN